MFRIATILIVAGLLAACSGRPAAPDAAPMEGQMSAAQEASEPPQTEVPKTGSAPAKESNTYSPDEPADHASVPTDHLKLAHDRTLLADTGDADIDLLITLRRQYFMASPSKRAMMRWVIAQAEPSDPKIKRVHELCVASYWPLRVGKSWLEGIQVESSGWTDQRTQACMDALMAEIERRGLVEKSVEGVEQLANREVIQGKHAWGTKRCHLESDDPFITRVRPLEPRRLKRPEGVDEGSEASIVVQIDEAGEASWVGTVGEPGPAAEACFEALSGPWTKPRNTDVNEPAIYCRQFRCQF